MASLARGSLLLSVKSWKKSQRVLYWLELNTVRELNWSETAIMPASVERLKKTECEEDTLCWQRLERNAHFFKSSLNLESSIGGIAVWESDSNILASVLLVPTSVVLSYPIYLIKLTSLSKAYSVYSSLSFSSSSSPLAVAWSVTSKLCQFWCGEYHRKRCGRTSLAKVCEWHFDLLTDTACLAKDEDSSQCSWVIVSKVAHRWQDWDTYDQER